MKAKLYIVLGLVVCAFAFSSCKKGKTVSCDWVGKAEYQKANHSSTK